MQLIPSINRRKVCRLISMSWSIVNLCFISIWKCIFPMPACIHVFVRHSPPDRFDVCDMYCMPMAFKKLHTCVRILILTAIHTICDVNSIIIGHSMDIVSMPKVPGCWTTFGKIGSVQAVDTISGLSCNSSGNLRGFTSFSDLKKMVENMQPKYNESGYKIIALTNYNKC